MLKFSPMLIISFATALLYIGFGIFILAKGNILTFTEFQKYGLGSLLIIYGLFRFYRSIKKGRELASDDEEE
jgi:hypothetical protein